MPIPQTQLETWSHRGAVTTSSAAYASITHALEQTSSPVAALNPRIFLQGSYANATNIYADSDIDVVVLYEGTFHKDLSALSPLAQQTHELTFGMAGYQWADLKRDALAALRAQYGASAVTLGNKSIKVQTGYGRMTADVVPAIQFRKYATYVDPGQFTAHWGIAFHDASGNIIVNYPQYHIDRGEAKNSNARTRGQYKETVRVVKNLRNWMVDNRQLAAGAAPSYYLECALYNVPDSLFIGNFTETIPAVLNYLLRAPFDTLICQNGVTPLIGNGPTQWPQDNFVAFILAANTAWDNW